MLEIPLLFKSEMVNAILVNPPRCTAQVPKTVTRRLITRVRGCGGPHAQRQVVSTFRKTTTPGYDWTFKARGCWQDLTDAQLLARSPYGVPGDVLWVRETFAAGIVEDHVREGSAKARPWVRYRADAANADVPKGWRWSPAIHMPRPLSRILLEVVSVRVEPLHAITDDDARREGTMEPSLVPIIGGAVIGGEREVFARLWEKINGKRGYGWHANPYVWRVEFKRIAQVTP